MSILTGHEIKMQQACAVISTRSPMCGASETTGKRNTTGTQHGRTRLYP